LRDYRAFLARHADEIAAFKARQQAAFEAEREHWRVQGHDVTASDWQVAEAAADSELDLPPGAHPVASHVAGSVWKLLVEEGAQVRRGDPLLVVESMKMEFTVAAPCAGRVHRVFCREGGHVAAGQDVVVVIEEGVA